MLHQYQSHHHSNVITTVAFDMSIREMANVIFVICLQAIIPTAVSQLLETTCQKRQKQLPSSHRNISKVETALHNQKQKQAENGGEIIKTLDKKSR